MNRPPLEIAATEFKRDMLDISLRTLFTTDIVISLSGAPVMRVTRRAHDGPSLQLSLVALRARFSDYMMLVAHEDAKLTVSASGITFYIYRVPEYINDLVAEWHLARGPVAADIGAVAALAISKLRATARDILNMTDELPTI